MFMQVVQCRKLLYELSGHSEQEEPPSTKPDGWKKACAAVLALTVSCLRIFNVCNVDMKFLSCKKALVTYTNIP